MASERIQVLIGAENRTQAAFDQVNKDITKLENNAKNIKRIGYIFSGIAAGALSGALAMNSLSDSVTESLTKLDNLGKASRRLGLTTDELQEMRIVAKASGVEISAFDTAFQRFARRAGQARLGTGELVKTFDYLNIKLDDSNGKIKSNADLFKEFSSKVAAVSDENIQLALTMSGVDTEGVKLIEMFRQSAQEQQNVIDKAKEFGGIYDEKLIKRAEHYLEQIELIKEAQDRINTQSELGSSAMVLEWEKLKLKIYESWNETLKFTGVMGVVRNETKQTSNEAISLYNQQIERLKEKLAVETDPRRIEALEKNLKYAEGAKAAIEGQLVATKELNEETIKTRDLLEELGGVEYGNTDFSKSVDELLEKLEEERYLLKLSAKEQFIYNQIKRAGKDATYEEINAIKKAAEALFNEKEQLKENRKQREKLTKSTKEYKDAANEVSSGSSSSLFGKEVEETKELTEATEEATKAKREWLTASSQGGKDTSDAFDPINLTPEQAKQKAKEIKTAMQQEFDNNPVQVKVKVPTYKEATETVTTSSSYYDTSTGLSALSIATEALKTGSK